MPKIFSYRQQFKQQVSLFFECEYCGQPFSVKGMMSTYVSTEKWVTERVEEAKAEMRQKAEQNLAFYRRVIEGDVFSEAELNSNIVRVHQRQI